MTTARRLAGALSWEELSEIAARSAVMTRDTIRGPTNPQATLRLFGAAAEDSEPRVTLYRDNHAWCPYCQKVWLFLEEKQVSYRVQKVTMFCYGDKEAWYKRKVPSGMLPALELDGRIITESDVILSELEAAFGPLHKGMEDKDVLPLRRLERALFQTWCGWLCYPNRPAEERRAQEDFGQVAQMVESALAATSGPYFLEQFSIADVVFTPYIERMAASLFFYKGFVLRDPQKHPRISAWFDAMETRPTYRGTQSDFHTHAHDLPPQMGGCYANGTAAAAAAAALVDEGPFCTGEVPDVGYAEPNPSGAGAAHLEAIARVVKHRRNLVAANAVQDKDLVDAALRCALTRLATGEAVAPPATATARGGKGSGGGGGGGGADVALRYIRDRVNVPRDMSPWAGRRLREALEATAALAGAGQGTPIPTRHRHDQDPRAFRLVA